MRKSEYLFLIFVGLSLVALVNQTWILLIPVHSSPADHPPTIHQMQTTGQPREADVATLKSMIEQGLLSDHTAQYWQPFDSHP